MQSEQFQAFTSYVLHADVICYHLEHRNWQAQAQQLVRDLVKQGNESAHLLAALGQTTHVVATKVKQLDALSDSVAQRLANASEIASDIAATRQALAQFGDNFRKQEEQTMASYSVVARALQDVRDLSETAVRLQGALYANLLTFQSVGFYAAALILAWFATSVPSTSTARLPLLFLVAAVFWTEYRIVHWFTAAAQHAAGGSGSTTVAFVVPSTLQEAVEVAAALFGTTPGSLRGFHLPTSDPSLYPSYQPPQQCIVPAPSSASPASSYTRPWWCAIHMVMPAVGELVRILFTYIVGTGLWLLVRCSLLLVAATWWALRLCAHMAGLTEGSTPAILNAIDTAFFFSDASKWHMAEARWAVRCGLCLAALVILWRAYRTHIDHAKAVYTMLQKTMQLQNGAAGYPIWPIHRPDGPSPLLLGAPSVSALQGVGLPLALRDIDTHLARSIAALRINQPMTVLGNGYVVSAGSELEEELDGDYIPHGGDNQSSSSLSCTGTGTGAWAGSRTSAASSFDFERLRPRHPSTGQALSGLPPLFALPVASSGSSNGGDAQGTATSHAHMNPVVTYESSAAFTQLVMLQEAAGKRMRELEMSDLAAAVGAEYDEEEDIEGLGWADDWPSTEGSQADMEVDQDGVMHDDDNMMGELSTVAEAAQADDNGGGEYDDTGAGTGLQVAVGHRGRAGGKQGASGRLPVGRKSILPQVGLLTAASSASGSGIRAGGENTDVEEEVEEGAAEGYMLYAAATSAGEGGAQGVINRRTSTAATPSKPLASAGGARKRKRASTGRARQGLGDGQGSTDVREEEQVEGEGREVLDLEAEEAGGQRSSSAGRKAKRRRT